MRRRLPLTTPTDLGAEAVRDLAVGLNGVLADVFALCLKTKNFHWHMSGRISATTICCSMSSPNRFSR
jgi:starvation-inducible DNA-binding protein